MDTRFFMKMRVTSYDVGPTRTLKPSALMKLMQEVAGRHLAQDGLTYEYMRERGIVFLLVRLAATISRMPCCDEEITVETWFERTEGVRFIRDIRFCDEKGEVFAEIATHWIIADPHTHKILRPSAFPFNMPAFGGETVKAIVSKIQVPDILQEAGTRIVRWSDIDCNNHMNNAVYADLLCDYYPGGLGRRELSFFQIDFDGETALGDKINIKTATDPNGCAMITGTVNTHKCFTAGCAGAVRE